MAWQLRRNHQTQDSRLHWEIIAEETARTSTPLGGFTISTHVSRAKVPGGWFVKVGAGPSAPAFFYPDPNHEWDGGSLP